MKVESGSCTSLLHWLVVISADVSSTQLGQSAPVYLQFVNGRVFWLDLDSRAGTSTEGQLRKFGWLEAGSSIRVGPFGIERLAGTGLDPENRHTALGSQVSPFVARSYGDQTLPEVSLEFLNGPSRSACWPMNRVMSLIGSANGCKFRLADPSVSALHCSLLRTPLGLWIVDLLGPDGTGVNDTQVRYALLAPTTWWLLVATVSA